ncbi:MAG: agmatine deiminase [Planctomycetaceae bacterium]|nr:agmatine deiminase [Planctomycetaceae bacterium]
MTTNEPTPAALGYRWPAEWEPHAATWLSWPHNPDTWPGKFEVIPERYTEFVRTIARFEPVNILAGGEVVMSVAASLVADIPDVRLYNIKTNDAWCRDHGPIFVVEEKGSGPIGAKHPSGRSGQLDLTPFLPPAIVDWGYNAWGGKYPPFDADNTVTEQVAVQLQRKRFVPGLVLEGGAIEGNGRGTILTTESCLLNPNRNENMTREQMEDYLSSYLGANNVLWLSRGELAGDDTDGHVDQLARFIDSHTIVAAWENDSSDVNHESLKANFEQLEGMADQDGNGFTIVRLPLPKPKFCQGQRLPASYCNFYITNGAVIVPQFDDAADEEAVRILEGLFPDREVIGLPSIDLVWGLGSFHCLTQQEPV